MIAHKTTTTDKPISTAIKDFLLDLVFPSLCFNCRELVTEQDNSFCGDCRAFVEFQKGFRCAFCTAPVVNGKTCPFCIGNHSLDRLFVAMTYENLVQKAIKTFKYRFILSLGYALGDLMAEYLKKELSKSGLDPSRVLCIPVPLSRRRFNWRGFNQAEILAGRLGLSIHKGLLKRKHSLYTQAQIESKTPRIENIKNHFEYIGTNPLAGATILLVDDVATTSATLDECARVLKANGAGEVMGLVLARGQ